jgi:hypothetical protein
LIDTVGLQQLKDVFFNVYASKTIFPVCLHTALTAGCRGQRKDKEGSEIEVRTEYVEVKTTTYVDKPFFEVSLSAPSPARFLIHD